MIQKFFSKISEKEKKFLYITVPIVCLAFVDRLFFGPVLDKLRQVNEDIAAQQNSITRDLRFLSYKDKILKESKAFGRYFTEKVEDDDVINAGFLGRVEKLAKDHKVSLIKSNPSKVNRQKKSIEYFAVLDCTGQLSDVVSFMHAVNSAEELLKVARFTMSPKRGTASEVNASMTLAKLVIHPGMSNDPAEPAASSVKEKGQEQGKKGE